MTFQTIDSQKPQQYYEKILVQTGSTKKEYQKLIAEMLSSLDFESEDEKFLVSSIKTVDLADDTTSVTINRTKKK
ncbi:hypothetical protein Gotur_019671 [Gossypium turneri]